MAATLSDRHAGSSTTNSGSRQKQGRASGSGDISWKRIWRLCVPPKVRVFWWRVINAFLPAKGVHKRHIEPVPNCDVCGAEDESIKHVLMDCTVARCFWKQTRTLTGAKLPHLHPHTWAHDLIDPNCCSECDLSLRYVVLVDGSEQKETW
jgi:hypothetical protein